ncbi:MAG: hypothetical protein EBU90_23730 [Proteobacteria bacterium]|nr:hypothetical protein [Pseudomonadota bacterium]NBP14794.1 hypothetical protein [bacterium]
MNLKYLLLFCCFSNLTINCNNEQLNTSPVSVQAVGLLIALQCKVVFQLLQAVPEYHPMQSQQNELNNALEIAKKEFGVAIVAEKNTDKIVKPFDSELYQAVYYVSFTELHELNVQWSIDWHKLCHEQEELKRCIKFLTSVLEKVQNKIIDSTDQTKKEALSIIAKCLAIDLSYFKAIIEKMDNRHVC